MEVMIYRCMFSVHTFLFSSANIDLATRLKKQSFVLLIANIQERKLYYLWFCGFP